jgi:hypothetical protein
MNDWTREEVEATVANYFEMLEAELHDRPVNKAERNRALQKIVHRSRGSIEFKHQNISAVLIELGCRYVDGYKPRRNYQDLLRTVIVDRLKRSKALRELLEKTADAPAKRTTPATDILDVIVPVPRLEPLRNRKGNAVLRDSSVPPPVVDYIEREQRNRSLGDAGEDFVMEYEHKRLWTAGQKKLADKVDRVSVTKGNHLGYDVHSFEESGGPRLIEVKTTRAGAMTPFFVSRNEVRVSEAEESTYHLYRVHRFEADAKIFILKGALPGTCDLDPTEFRARVKPSS